MNFLRPAAVMLLMLLAGQSAAQQFSLMGGAVRDHGWNDDAKSYALGYSAPLNKTLSYSLGYLNEGHVTDHHRDGIGAQLWAGLDLTNK